MCVYKYIYIYIYICHLKSVEVIIPGLHAGSAGCLHLAGADSAGARPLPLQAVSEGGPVSIASSRRIEPEASTDITFDALYHPFTVEFWTVYEHLELLKGVSHYGSNF